VGYVLHEHIIHWLVLQAPQDTLKAQNDTLLTFTPAESFLTSIWISIYFGIVLALPVIFWQVWQFFVPAVDKQHARLIKYFVVLAWVLAVVGLVFGYYVVLPAALGFLLNFNSDTFSNSLQAKPFLSFCVRVEFAMAIVFELPLFVVGLTRLGILKTESLRKNRRLGYFVTACVAVALPGVDPVTLFFELIPLLVLFEGSIWLAVLLDRRSRRMQRAGGAAVET
jgi:sec-independent protein translocase protein TatC